MTRRTSTPLAAGALVLVAVLAFALNPSAERHRAAIREAVGQRSPIAGALGLGAVAALVTRYHSLGIGSYTTSNERIVSVGTLGMVHVRDLLPDK